MNILIVSDSNFVLRKMMADVRLILEEDIYTLKWRQRHELVEWGVSFDVALISVKMMDHDWLKKSRNFIRRIFLDKDRLNYSEKSFQNDAFSFSTELHQKLLSLKVGGNA